MTRHKAAQVLAVVLLGLAVSLQAQKPPLPLQLHLQADQFQIVTSLRGLPLGVRDYLQTLFGVGTLDIAEPGAAFQGTTERVSLTMPARRLVAAGCASDNHCLVYYEKGGTTLTHRVALFQWTPGETKLNFGGAAPAGLKTVDDVKKAVLSGAIKTDKGPW